MPKAKTGSWVNIVLTCPVAKLPVLPNFFLLPFSNSFPSLFPPQRSAHLSKSPMAPCATSLMTPPLSDSLENKLHWATGCKAQRINSAHEHVTQSLQRIKVERFRLWPNKLRYLKMEPIFGIYRTIFSSGQQIYLSIEFFWKLLSTNMLPFSCLSCIAIL